MYILDFSYDGTELFIGGSHLQKVQHTGRETKNNQLKIVFGTSGSPDFPVRDLKTLEDGRLVVHQAGSNNVIFYSKSLQVLKELKGFTEKYACSSA